MNLPTKEVSFSTETATPVTRRSSTTRFKKHLRTQGASTLRDADLLSFLLRLPDSQEAERILSMHPIGSLTFMSIDQLDASFGPKRAPTVLAVAEMVRRLNRSTPYGSRPEPFGEIIAAAADIRREQREHLLVFLLNARHRIVGRETVSIGTLTASMAHPREIFVPALKSARGVASIVLVHNHPSGDPSPSDEDKRLTDRITQAGRMLGIELLDHIVVAEHGTYSFKMAGAL